MKRIGTLNGRAVVQGDPNIVKPNEILLQNKEEKDSFAIVDKDNNILGLVGEWDYKSISFGLLIQYIRNLGFKIDTSKIEIN